MNDQIIDILQLPKKCLVNKKITKAFFKRNFDLSTTEKSILDDYNIVIAIDWIASVSLSSANIPEWCSTESSFEEIQVIAVTSSSQGLNVNSGSIIDLVQKYIPYHILLIVHDSVNCIWNVSYKKINQVDKNKRTVDKKFTTDKFCINSMNEIYVGFINSLRFDKVITTDLKALYDSYVQCFIALNNAPILGTYETRTIKRSKEDLERLEQIESLDKEINRLAKNAQKETQMSIRVQLNDQINNKRKQIESLKNIIKEA